MTASQAQAADAEDLFAGSGEMAALMRSHDWTSTRLGPVETWPQSLCTMVRLILHSPFPMAIWWGDELVLLYNDAWHPIAGVKHPSALGSPAQEIWSEIWDVISVQMKAVMAMAQPTLAHDMQFFLERHGYIEEAFFTYSFSPIFLKSGLVGGAFTAVTETTQQVIAARRLQMLSALAMSTAEVNSLENSCCRASAVLASNPEDITFALLYLVEPESNQALLVEAVNVEAGTSASPKQVDVTQTNGGWKFNQVQQTGKTLQIDDLAELGTFSGGAWDEPSRSALVLPIAQTSQMDHTPLSSGFLVLGISPRQQLDDDYQGFLTLVATSISTMIARACDYEAESRQVEILATQRQQINAILESISDAFVAFDHQWHYTYVNQRAAQMLNQSREELLGKQLWAGVFSPTGAFGEHELRRAMTDQVPVVFEDFNPQTDRWMVVNAYPSGDGLAIYFQDISDRKRSESQRHQAEAALRVAYSQLEYALEVGSVYTWRWHIPSDCVIVNTALADLFSVDPEKASTEGLPLESFLNTIHTEDRLRVSAAIQQAIEMGERYLAEYRVQTATGDTRWLAARGQVEYDEAGHPVSFPGALIDITERKLAEVERNRLLAREQASRAAAEDASRIKDEFLAVVSHELRTPLNPILGWSQLLQTQQLSQEDTEKAVETIARNAWIQTQLIDDLLDVSRILRGKLTLSQDPVDLIPVINAALETVSLAAKGKSIEINTQLSSEVGLVLGDPGRLQQILWNLLSNAVKFTPEGGQVDIHLVRINHQAQVKVSDTGKGIPPEFVPHVFDRFRQEDTATTRQFGGLGLGLAIVHHLTALHGGTVQAESLGEGQGASFTVELPLIPQAHPTTLKDEVSTPSCNLQGIQALVVDDDPDSLEIMVYVLKQAGANVRVCSSANEALTALTQTQPDILISDIAMPEEDGYTLMRQIRALPPEQGGQIPAIALTAYAREEDRQQALQVGYQQHITKPIDIDELVKVVVGLIHPESFR